MGTQVTSDSLTDSKPQYTVAIVAAAAVAIDASQMAIFAGSLGDQRRLEAVSDLQQCHDKFREDSAPAPGVVTSYIKDIGSTKGAVEISSGAVAATITESQVGLFVGNTFAPPSGRSQIITGQFNRLRESYIEDRKAA